MQGVVFASLDLPRFSRLVGGAKMSPGSVFVVGDRQGVVLDRYPDPQHWVGHPMPEASIARKLLADEREGAEETIGPDGVRRLYAFSALGDRIGDPDLIIGLGFPSSVAYDIAQMIVRTLVGLGLVGILTFGLAHVSASVLFLRPVNTLVATTRRLNEGDTSARTNLRHDTGEFGQLAQAIDQLERTESILFALAVAVEAKDPYTEGHLRRLEEYSAAIATAMGLSSHMITVIRYGALLHDIGKIGIPEAILNKPGKLTPDEYEIVKQHPIIGERICRALRHGAEVGPIVRGHHERWDGAGYPDGLAGEAIPVGSRIIAVADAFDAMTTNRPYRKALPLRVAWEALRQGAGTQWNRAVIEAFALSEKAKDEVPEAAV